MEEFNWLIYINKYNDLKNNGLNTKEKAINHFNNYGKKEGRDCLLSNFEMDYYIANNKDVKIKYKNNRDDIFNHWINFGIFENRISSSNYFDWNYYKNKNFDIEYQYITNEEKAINHYFLYGINEKIKLNNNFVICKYITFSSIKEYIEIYAKHSRIFFEKHNHIDVDLFFYKFVNNIDINSKHDLLAHFHVNGYKGLIYHPKQLYNIFPKLNFYLINQKIYVEFKNNLVLANKFVKKKIYEKNFNYFENILIKQKYNTIMTEIEYSNSDEYNNFDENNNLNEIIYKKNSDNSLLILIFIGNEPIGQDLINKVILYKEIEKFDVAICFSSTDLFKKMKDKIIFNFKYVAIYISNEFGNDIMPTILMYDNLSQYINYEHIIKLQTKSDINKYNELTNYLLSKTINNLLLEKRIDCNCIANHKYYFHVSRDGLNTIYYRRYNDYVDRNCHFVEGTIFYISSIHFYYVLNFIKKNNFHEYILNNLYDNNCTFQDNSPIHFLERLFGIIIDKKELVEEIIEENDYVEENDYIEENNYIEENDYVKENNKS